MDPLTIIAAALVAGATAALKDTAAQAIKDAYTGIKSLIARKLSQPAKLNAALTLVEDTPSDPSLQKVLDNAVKSSGLNDDADVLRSARELMELIKLHEPSIAAQYQVNVTGSGAAAVGPGARAAGERGVIVDGDISGNINTGNNTSINTGGGAYVGGNVQSGGGFVGRDQTVNNFYGQSPADPANAAGTGLVASAEGRKIYQLLNDYFNLSDIEGLCFEMGIDEENLRGETKAGKARALVQQLGVSGRLDELKKLMRVQRPNLRSQLQ